MCKLSSLVFLVSFGCDDGAAPTTTRVDSAGVSIVTMSPDTSGLPKWRLSDEPELVLGARDDVPGHDLYQVNHAVQLQDGRLVVADAGSGELRYFDQAGELTTRVGGRGEGPGEFQWFGWLRRRPGDSVLVYDPFQQRLSMFDPAGNLVRTSPVRGYDSIPFPSLEIAWEDGTLLLRRGLLPPSFSDVQRPAFQLYLGHLGESAVELVGEYAGDAGYHLQSNQSVTVWPVPFGARTAVAAHDDRWYVGDNARFIIDVFAPDGHRTHSFRRARPPVPVTASDVEQFVAEVLAGIPVERRDRLAAVLEDVEAPSTQPTLARRITCGSSQASGQLRTARCGCWSTPGNATPRRAGWLWTRPAFL